MLIIGSIMMVTWAVLGVVIVVHGNKIRESNKELDRVIERIDELRRNLGV